MTGTLNFLRSEYLKLHAAVAQEHRHKMGRYYYAVNCRNIMLLLPMLRS